MTDPLFNVYTNIVNVCLNCHHFYSTPLLIKQSNNMSSSSSITKRSNSDHQSKRLQFEIYLLSNLLTPPKYSIIKQNSCTPLSKQSHLSFDLLVFRQVN